MRRRATPGSFREEASTIKKRSAAERPERTRGHYIEALSRNHVERFIFLRGHTSSEPKSDYGYDILMTTFDYDDDPNFGSGDLENGQVYIQLIEVEISRRHVALWQNEPFPIS